MFLGDYVNRGIQSVECISLLVALKVQYPEKIALIRGNHECRDITKIYGFYTECMKHFGDEGENVWNAFHEVFDCLPLAALIDDQVSSLTTCLLLKFGTCLVLLRAWRTVTLT